MSPADAKFALKLLCGMTWPSGIVVQMRLSESEREVVVSMGLPGQKPDIFRFSRMVTRYTRADLMQSAHTILESARMLAEDDEPEPCPEWLRATMARIETMTFNPAICRENARYIIGALEMDMPIPIVYAEGSYGGHGLSINVVWNIGLRNVTLSFWSSRTMGVFVRDETASMYGDRYPMGSPVESRTALNIARSLTKWVLGNPHPFHAI